MWAHLAQMLEINIQIFLLSMHRFDLISETKHIYHQSDVRVSV